MNEAYFLDRAVGALIKNRRRRKNLVQEQLADKTGISQSTISRIESGYHGCTLSELEIIEKVLGKKIEVEAREIVNAARAGAGAISVTARRVEIRTEDLIRIIAERWV